MRELHYNIGIAIGVLRGECDMEQEDLWKRIRRRGFSKLRLSQVVAMEQGYCLPPMKMYATICDILRECNKKFTHEIIQREALQIEYLTQVAPKGSRTT